MYDDSQDFWVTEISNTPERDKQFGGGQFLLLILVAVGVLAGLAAFFAHH
jgi:hypothetical protein